MHGIELILTLTSALTAALILGYLTQRLSLSPLVGYLLAGVLVGPHTPGLVADTNAAEQLAEIGVILLMFGVGLQSHLDDLLAVARVAVPGAIAQSVVAAALGALVARAFGWAWPGSIVFGAALAVASTVVLIRVLTDNRDLHTRTGHIAVGWLVVEDLFTVLALVLLPLLVGAEESPANLTWALMLTAAKVAGLVAFALVVGNRAIPWLLDNVAATRSRELFTLTVLVIALGIAVGAARLFGVSMALGAFLAGLVVGRSDYSSRAASEALPMRDAFAVLFFVSVGMLLDPRVLIEDFAFIAAALAVVMIGKPLVAVVVILVMKYPLRVALTVGIALAQIGEFSFILAAFGEDLGLLTDRAMNTIVAVSIISIIANPPLYRVLDRLEDWTFARTPLRPSVSKDPRREAEPALDPIHHAVLVGYGPSGRTLARLLQDNEIESTVIELNMDTVRRLRDEGQPAVYGDARHRETLEAAGVEHAGSLILSAAGMRQSEEVIRVARELNPRLHILARASYLREVEGLQKAGADHVFSGEGEVALALMEAILARLGATPEQIERERERAHRELFGPPRSSKG